MTVAFPNERPDWGGGVRGREGKREQGREGERESEREGEGGRRELAGGEAECARRARHLGS